MLAFSVHQIFAALPPTMPLSKQIWIGKQIGFGIIAILYLYSLITSSEKSKKLVQDCNTSFAAWLGDLGLSFVNKK
ncbi:MAG: hypothetical protein ABSG87_04120 [Verrucomicrobiota bacterium]|jgi:hypothetical protein